MARTYTPDQRAAALAALEINGGALRATARETGIPAPTLQFWRDSEIGAAYAVQPVQEKIDFGGKLGRLFSQALDLMAQKLPTMEGRDLAVATGILSDKLLDHREGRRGATVSIDQRQQQVVLPAGLTIEELRELARGGSE